MGCGPQAVLGPCGHGASAQELLLRLGLAALLLGHLVVHAEGLDVPVAAQPALEPLQACNLPSVHISLT